MKTTIKHFWGLVFMLLLASALAPSASVAAQTSVLNAHCSGDVIIAPHKDGLPDAEGAVALNRDNAQHYAWQMVLVEDETVHWYCYDDSIWKKLDPRVWRIKSITADAACDETGSSCVLSVHLGVGTSAINGWYPETVTCQAGTVTHVRLGPGALVEMRCA